MDIKLMYNTVLSQERERLEQLKDEVRVALAEKVEIECKVNEKKNEINGYNDVLNKNKDSRDNMFLKNNNIFSRLRMVAAALKFIFFNGYILGAIIICMIICALIWGIPIMPVLAHFLALTSSLLGVMAFYQVGIILKKR